MRTYPFLNSLGQDWLAVHMNIIAPIFAAVLIWSLVWKGLALWRAARNGQSAWFVVMLVLNTLGILEIIYLLTAGKKKQV